MDSKTDPRLGRYSNFGSTLYATCLEVLSYLIILLFRLLIIIFRNSDPTGQENGRESSGANESSSDKESDSPPEPELSDGLGSDSDLLGVDTHPDSTPSRLSPQPLDGQVFGADSDTLRRSKRTRPQKSFRSDEIRCEDSDCEDELSPDGMVQCAGPACGAFVRSHYKQFKLN